MGEKEDGGCVVRKPHQKETLSPEEKKAEILTKQHSLLDHIIFNKKGYYSMLEQGTL